MSSSSSTSRIVFAAVSRMTPKLIVTAPRAPDKGDAIGKSPDFPRLLPRVAVSCCRLGGRRGRLERALDGGWLALGGRGRFDEQLHASISRAGAVAVVGVRGVG